MSKGSHIPRSPRRCISSWARPSRACTGRGSSCRGAWPTTWARPRITEATKSVAPRDRGTAAMVCAWRAREIGDTRDPATRWTELRKVAGGHARLEATVRDRALADRELYPHPQEIVG